MKLYKLPTAIALSLLFCLTTIFPASRASQGQRRTLTLSQHKDPPIEIVSIDLAGKALLPNTEFSAPDGWTEDLHITVKNNSEEPISRIEMILGIFTKPDAVALTAHYWFGNRQGTESLPPGSTVVLTHIGTKGDNNAQGTVKLSIASVIWNGDDSLKWDGGGIRRKAPSSEVGEPPTYHADPQPLAKYQYPKWFKPAAKIVRARSMLAVTYCNQKITDNSFKYCNVYCTGTQYRCWVPKDIFDPNPDPGETLDSISVPYEYHCESGFCVYTSCWDWSTSPKADYDCTPIQSPIIYDRLRNGIQLTDVEHGVVFDITGSGRAILIAWTAPGSDDAFLVRDVNKNGLIDNGRELFGNNTPQPPSFAPNGFRALISLDSNHDGVVDGKDQLYNDLQWWTDRNHDGVSQSSELGKLTETLSTSYKLSRKVDEYGNQFRYRAKVDHNNWMIDVFLVVRP